MKVKELIEKLQQLDPELLVMVNGYERGVEDLEELEEIEVALNQNDVWYYGKHEKLYDRHYGKYKQAIKIKAILLPR